VELIYLVGRISYEPPFFEGVKAAADEPVFVCAGFLKV
jgi:hypothetical protein